MSPSRCVFVSPSVRFADRFHDVYEIQLIRIKCNLPLAADRKAMVYSKALNILVFLANTATNVKMNVSPEQAVPAIISICINSMSKENPDHPEVQ